MIHGNRLFTTLGTAAVAMIAALSIGPSSSYAASATTGLVVPKPTGKIVHIGRGVSVQLEKGWIVGGLYQAVGGSHGHSPYVEIYRNSPRAVFYVFADGEEGSATASQILARNFPQWSHGWLVDPHTSKVDAFSIGGTSFDRAAGVHFTGRQAGRPVKGIALALLDTYIGLAATVYAVADVSEFTQAVQGQVEGMVDSVVSLGVD